MEHLEGFEITPYFENRVLGDPVRVRLVPYIPRTVNDFEHRRFSGMVGSSVGATYLSWGIIC